MSQAEFVATIMVLQKMDQGKDFDRDKFLNRNSYFENYPEEKKAYFERIKKKNKEKGIDGTLAEEKNVKDIILKGK